MRPRHPNAQFCVPPQCQPAPHGPRMRAVRDGAGGRGRTPARPPLRGSAPLTAGFQRAGPCVVAAPVPPRIVPRHGSRPGPRLHRCQRERTAFQTRPVRPRQRSALERARDSRTPASGSGTGRRCGERRWPSTRCGPCGRRWAVVPPRTAVPVGRRKRGRRRGLEPARISRGLPRAQKAAHKPTTRGRRRSRSRWVVSSQWPCSTAVPSWCVARRGRGRVVGPAGDARPAGRSTCTPARQRWRGTARCWISAAPRSRGATP